MIHVFICMLFLFPVVFWPVTQAVRISNPQFAFSYHLAFMYFRLLFFSSDLNRRLFPYKQPGKNLMDMLKCPVSILIILETNDSCCHNKIVFRIIPIFCFFLNLFYLYNILYNIFNNQYNCICLAFSNIKCNQFFLSFIHNTLTLIKTRSFLLIL